MLMWLIQIILVIIIMRFIEEIGLGGSCLFFGVLHVIAALFGYVTFWGLVGAFIGGVIYGFFAYFIAKILLFLIDILGSIGTVIVFALFIFAILAIIF